MSTSSLKSLVVGDLVHELATTRRVLERIPEEHLAWKPHAKSMSLGGLAQHLANLVLWQLGMLTEEAFDMASVPSSSAEPASLEAVLHRFDEHAAALRAALDKADEAAFTQPWSLKRGEQVLFTRPRALVLRTMGISHMVHHRGQLSVYLRLLDVPVPSVYGPTADEPGRLG